MSLFVAFIEVQIALKIASFTQQTSSAHEKKTRRRSKTL